MIEVIDTLTDPPRYSAVRATLNVLVEKGQATFRQEWTSRETVERLARKVQTARKEGR